MARSTMILETHEHAPSALAFMSRAFRSSPGWHEGRSFPHIVERWQGLRVDAKHLAAFCNATGSGDDDGISVLYPHVLGYRLHMALLTHSAFPLPIWNALQTRNRLVLHRHVDPGDAFDLETSTGAHRLVDKGMEVELRSCLARGTEPVWESHVTYFYRGRFGAGPVEARGPPSPDLSGAPVVDRFTMPARGGWRFGALTGDYNGIHWWPWYARRFGFRTAFSHPQRAAGMCMARLQVSKAGPQTLDLWIKGPVIYGANLTLAAASHGNGLAFGLSLDGDPRMALVGLWQNEVVS